MISFFCHGKRELAGYLLTVLLIPLYVSLFPLWKVLNGILPKWTMIVLPIAATASAALLAIVWYRRNNRDERRKISLITLVIGALICLLALAIPDPAYPVKRIHVAEYMLIALISRYAMSAKLSGSALLLFSALYGAVLGVHDEFLQGLHPSRTYGLRDMSVNGLASCGGALLWHGMHFFTPESALSDGEEPNTTPLSVLFLVTLVGAIVAMVVPLMYFKGHTLPIWPGIILTGTLVFWAVYRNCFLPDWQPGMTAVSLAAFSLLIYPLIPYISSTTFF